MKDGPVSFSPGVYNEATRQLERFGVVEKLLEDAEQHQYSISRIALRTLTFVPMLRANESGKVIIGVVWDFDQRSKFYSEMSLGSKSIFCGWINAACERLGVIGEVATAVYDPVDNEYLMPEEAQGKLAHLQDHAAKLGEALGIKQGTVPRLKRLLPVLQVELKTKSIWEPEERTAFHAAQELEKALSGLDRLSGETLRTDTSGDDHESESDSEIARRLHPGLG